MLVLARDEVARETRRLGAGEPRSDAHAVGRVPPLGDWRAQVVEIGERPPVRVRNEQPDVLESVGEKLGDSLLERVEALARARRDQQRTRIGVLDTSAPEWIEQVRLVEDELGGDVVCSDLDENRVDRRDRLRETLLGTGCIRDVQHEVGDERLFQRRGKPLDELRRQATDEANGVGHEVALALVLEASSRWIERLEQAVVDGRLCTCQRIEQRRLADVGVAGERDRRCARPQALLSARRALPLESAQSTLEQRHASPREPAIRLELALSRASRPDASSEPLEVLPHAAHAREVVLELRELDLQLALGAPCVLGEDVEDQLGAVDDSRLQSVLERTLLGRSELVVREEHLGGMGAELLLQLGELALADERPRIRVGAMLHERADRRNTGRPGELGELGELLGPVCALSIDADEEPALRLRPGCGIGLARSHRVIMPRYAPAVTALADRLAARTLELVDIPSQSGHEDAIRAHLLALVPPGWEPEYAGDEAYFFMPPRRPGRPLVVLAAHYDTVPPQGNVPGRIADGEVCGLGASDMKGGLAVALELARDLDLDATTFDLGLLLFGREELPAEQNPLPALFEGSRAIHDVALAVVLEPTDLELQSGCLGNVVARLTFSGTSGHSARPWLADSALERAVKGLSPLFELEPRVAVVGGLEFREVVSVTRLDAGIADNVIPGEATATLNLRYPPDRTPAEAESYLASLTPEGASLDVVSNAAPARVVADAPAVRALQRAGSLVLRPKQAWTNVADFTTRGLDAVNFGPGHTALAHHREERVAISSLVAAYEVLWRFVTSPIGDDPA